MGLSVYYQPQDVFDLTGGGGGGGGDIQTGYYILLAPAPRTMDNQRYKFVNCYQFFINLSSMVLSHKCAIYVIRKAFLQSFCPFCSIKIHLQMAQNSEFKN